MSSYRICNCGQINSAHVCGRYGGVRSGASTTIPSITSLSSNPLLESIQTAHLGGSYSNVEVQLASQRYQPHHLDLPFSGYPLTWGYNREYSLGDDVKFYYTPLSRQYHARPYSECEYNVSRYHVELPSHMYWTPYKMF